MREFLGEWNLGPLHGHPFMLSGRGSATILHKHVYDHVVFANKRFAVYAKWPDGYEKVEAVGVWPDKRYIPKGVEHIVIALEDGDTHCECLFARHDENGVALFNPKELMPEPYREDNSNVVLPALLQELLAREGICAA